MLAPREDGTQADQVQRAGQRPGPADQARRIRSSEQASDQV
ncbi:MAG: hypothetical protein ABSA53_23250 [Streptosporangiaceae bacterium]